MRKQESVHLHALQLEIARYLDDHPEMPPVDLSEYNATEVGPSSVHRSKGDHEEAVVVLTTAIRDCLRRATGPGQEPPAP